MTDLAHLAGDTSVPLLERTIGADLEPPSPGTATATRSSSPFEGVRLTYAELGAEVDRVAKALLAARPRRGDRVGIWSPNCAAWVLVQYATAKIGVDPRQHQPRVPHPRGAVRARAVGLPDARRRHRRSRRATTWRWSTRSAATLPDLEQVVFLGTDDWDDLLARRRRRSTDAALAARACAAPPDDPINIQYTSGTTGFPKGATLSHRNILNNGFFVGEALRLHRGRPGVHPGALLPLLRDGARQPRRAPRTAPRWSSPRRRSIPRPRSRPSRPSAARASTACPRCSSPSSPSTASPSYDLAVAAHRDHGRLAVPGGGDEAVRLRRCTWTR